MEGITETGSPDMKYYAFDWDDNIASMPTKIILKNKDGDSVGMSTEDFAHYRSIIGKEDFKYKGEDIVGYGEEPFQNFNVKGDKQFIIDAQANEINKLEYELVKEKYPEDSHFYIFEINKLYKIGATKNLKLRFKSGFSN